MAVQEPTTQTAKAASDAVRLARELLSEGRSEQADRVLQIGQPHLEVLEEQASFIDTIFPPYEKLEEPNPVDHASSVEEEESAPVEALGMRMDPNSRKAQVLRYVGSFRQVTSRDAIHDLGFPDGTISGHLAKMKDDGLIESDDSSPQKYSITPMGETMLDHLSEAETEEQGLGALFG